MSAQIKEALAALAEIRDGQEPTSFRFAVVRTALESAQREAVAWEAIEAWSAKHVDAVLRVTRRGWSVETDDGDGLEEFPSRGQCATTRLEALEAAAKWCRAEMAK